MNIFRKSVEKNLNLIKIWQINRYYTCRSVYIDDDDDDILLNSS